MNALEVLLSRHVCHELTMIDYRSICEGDIYWLNSEGHLHREDGPAVERVEGETEWWVNGKQISAPAGQGN